MQKLIGIFKHEFLDFCTITAPASQNVRCVLSHKSRVFLFLYRMTQDASTHVLGALFKINHVTAMKVFDDILFYLLIHDPHIPRVWNDSTATEADIEELLVKIRDSQSPGIR